MPVNEKITNELHTLFFNQEAGFSASLATLDEIIEREKVLEMIIFEGKAKLGAVSAEKRKRIANLSVEERERLLTNPDLNVSDSISAVKSRKDRMSKMDKAVNDMRAQGIPEEMIQAMVKLSLPDGEKAGARELVDRRPPEPVITFSKGANTQASLLTDITANIAEAVNHREPDAAYKLVVTAAHIAGLVHPELKLDIPDEIQSLENIQSLTSVVTDTDTDTSENPFATPFAEMIKTEPIPVVKEVEEYNPFK